ncbi:inositol monophosphatase family protein [Limnohabitans sp. 2KL-27]|uniref:inositol monophosphatase family protein n=1 Tax=Limnohabitans sp. 2KL-27 TaxID=1100705 RepID=UPI000B32AC9D|nr:inositol monophosphatase family protein [Limnohabitans sp. 2KL-27]
MTDLARHARDFAQDLALEAARMIQQAAGQQHAIELKSAGDWCSALDRRIEDHLKARIAQAYPEHGFLGEESAKTQVSDGLLWVIDPIDGSMNFLRGYPQFSVSIALLSDGEPIAACIVDPCRQEVFSAAVNQGATLNGSPMQVAATDHLQLAVAATVFPKPRAASLPDYLTQFGRAVSTVAGVRRSGSMALELAYLAAGRVDVFWSHDMGSWDAAAGVLLIREAGGQVFTLDGLVWHASRRIAAATPQLIHSWLELLCPKENPPCGQLSI